LIQPKNTGQMKVFTSLRSETIFVHNNCCCRPFRRPGKYFSFHEFLHMIYGRKKTFISFYPTLFYSKILLHIICTYFKEIFHGTTLRWTEFIALAYDGRAINNVGPRNKFSDKKMKKHNKRYYVLE